MKRSSILRRSSTCARSSRRWTPSVLAIALGLCACRSDPNIDEEPRPFGDVRHEAPADAKPASHPVPAPEVAAKPVEAPPAASAKPIAPASENAKGTEPAKPAAPVADAPKSAPETAQHPVNRDAKGDRDVERYIQRLESQEREKELKVDVVIARLELPADAIIGDLGCGPGLFSLAFAAACPEGVIYASDIEPAQLDRVRTKADEHKLRNVIPVLASANDPHFPLNQLDFVFIADTYHHLDDRVAYMRRLKDVLKPGGKLVLLEYKPGTIPVGPPADHKLAAGVMDREMEQAGYVLIDRFTTHAWHDFEVWRRLHPWERR